MGFLVVIIGGLVLLAVAYKLHQQQREKDLLQRIQRSEGDPSLLMAEMDQAIAQEKKRKEFWKRQTTKRLD